MSDEVNYSPNFESWISSFCPLLEKSAFKKQKPLRCCKHLTRLRLKSLFKCFTLPQPTKLNRRLLKRMKSEFLGWFLLSMRRHFAIASSTLQNRRLQGPWFSPKAAHKWYVNFTHVSIPRYWLETSLLLCSLWTSSLKWKPDRNRISNVTRSKSRLGYPWTILDNPWNYSDPQTLRVSSINLCNIFRAI